MKIVIFKKKKINLGEQPVTEWTLLEYKKWFSIKLFHFHKTEGYQDRFHTHAFNAYSFLLKGDYIEEIIENGHILKVARSRERMLFIPRDSYHRITKSNGCWTLLFTGPWGNEFKELRGEVTQGETTWCEWVCGPQRKDLRKLDNIKLEG